VTYYLKLTSIIEIVRFKAKTTVTNITHFMTVYDMEILAI